MRSIFPKHFTQFTALIMTLSYSQTQSFSVSVEKHPLSSLTKNWDFSWIDQLTAEAQITDPSENNKMRPVKNGHYVQVKPRPLRNPRLVIHSPDMARSLGFTEEDVQSPEFLKFFSGDVTNALNTKIGEKPWTWATPYALSIMGTRYTSNCPYGTGDGYGDGRAISIGEILHNSERWEMQLKGAGPTPFCRGADGRAVLRSSIREFLASEAMHYLGIPTTRALSLIVSEKGDTSKRPWYSDQIMNISRSPSSLKMDDPRLAKYDEATRKEILKRVQREKRDPDMMIEEPCAITCRVAPSFVRVGHVDLFARRVNRLPKKDGNFDTSTQQWKELEEMVWHAAFREFKEDAYDPFYEKGGLKGAAEVLLEKSAEGISSLVANWVRVGFCQGNFNADNCLVAGRTMDYGPFGFMDEYDPLFAKWTGSGEHFGFLNQPYAGLTNYVTLVESILPILSSAGEEEMHTPILKKAQILFQDKMDGMWNEKLGFHRTKDEFTKGGSLWRELHPLMRDSRVDWTLFWRELYHVAKEFPLDSTNYDQMLQLLEGNDKDYPGTSPFYEPLSTEAREQWIHWIRSWRTSLSNSADTDNIAERMRLANPKYILREWMLVECYTKAMKGDESMIHELLELTRKPYEEGTTKQEEKFYKRAPDSSLTAGGTAFMS